MSFHGVGLYISRDMPGNRIEFLSRVAA